MQFELNVYGQYSNNMNVLRINMLSPGTCSCKNYTLSHGTAGAYMGNYIDNVLMMSITIDMFHLNR